MARYLAFVAVLAGGVVADLWTKAWAWSFVPPGVRRKQLIEGFFYITRLENDGAMWSLFQGLPSWVWVVLRSSVFLLILGFYLTQKNLALWVHVAFAMVLAGALGNLHDNAFGNGRVRDFLLFYFGDWAYPAFNVADALICTGAALLLVYFLFFEQRPRRKPA